jgi:5S rRNA maturation endonuclease (ribonuclease M5)
LIKDERVDPSACNDIALTTALRESKSDIVKDLLSDRRVNPNHPPGYKLALCLTNESLLKVASECGRFDINGEHNSALVFAARRNWHKVIKIILKRQDSDPNRYGPFSAALCAAKSPDGYSKYRKTIQLFLKDYRLILTLSHLRMSAALDEMLFHFILTDQRLYVVGTKLGNELQKIVSTSRWTIPQVRNFLVMRGCIIPSYDVFSTIIDDKNHCQEVLRYTKWNDRLEATNQLLITCINLFRYDLVADHVLWVYKNDFVPLDKLLPEVFLQPSFEFVKKSFRFYHNDKDIEKTRCFLNQLMMNSMRNQNDGQFVGMCLTLSDWKCYNDETASFLFERLFQQIFENQSPDDTNSNEIIQFDSDEWGSFSFCSLLYRCFVVNCGIYDCIDSRLMIQTMVDELQKHSSNVNILINWDPNGEAICYLMNQKFLSQSQTDLLQFLLNHPILGIMNDADRIHQIRKYNISKFIQNKNQRKYDLIFEHACKLNDYDLVAQLLTDGKMTYYRDTIKSCLYSAALGGHLTLVYNILTNLTLFMDNGGLFEIEWIYNLIEETRLNGHTKTSKMIETFVIHDQKVFYYTFDEA